MDINLLEAVRNYADKAHGDQRRKYSPDRYIVHPIRVMELCRRFNQDTAVLSAALLHDVLEDTKVTKQQLHDFLLTIMDAQGASRTMKLVVELTDIYTKENYPHYNRRKRKRKEADRIERTSSESQTIKYADIIDNVPEITEHDPDFANTFLHECRQLLYRMKKGNKELYEQAVHIVKLNLVKLKENTMVTRDEKNPASGNKQSDYAGTNTERYGDQKPMEEQDNPVNPEEAQNVIEGERMSGADADHARNKANENQSSKGS